MPKQSLSLSNADLSSSAGKTLARAHGNQHLIEEWLMKNDFKLDVGTSLPVSHGPATRLERRDRLRSDRDRSHQIALLHVGFDGRRHRRDLHADADRYGERICVWSNRALGAIRRRLLRARPMAGRISSGTGSGVVARRLMRRIVGEVRMGWSGWMRQMHRWISLIFTLNSRSEYSSRWGWAGNRCSGCIIYRSSPLALLFLTGVYLFVLPYVRRRSSAR